MDKSRKSWQMPEITETTVREAIGPTGATGPMPKGLIAEPESSLGPSPAPKLGGPPTQILFGPPVGPFGPPGLYGPRPANGIEGPPVQPSDVRLKEDVNSSGVAENGLPLYTFRYRGHEGLYEGVMAQDVLQVQPDAVVVGRDGYLRVDYAKLGLKLRRLN